MTNPNPAQPKNHDIYVRFEAYKKHWIQKRYSLLVKVDGVERIKEGNLHATEMRLLLASANQSFVNLNSLNKNNVDIVIDSYGKKIWYHCTDVSEQDIHAQACRKIAAEVKQMRDLPACPMMKSRFSAS